MNDYTYDQLSLDMEESFERTINQEDMDLFFELSGDGNPLHTNPDYAKTTSFKKPVVYGLLVNSLFSRLVGEYLPGKHSLLMSVDSQFRNPCFVGDKLRVFGRITHLLDAGKVATIKGTIENQEGKILVSSKIMVKVLS